MDTAIAKFTVMQVRLLGTLASQFGHTGHGLSFPFRRSNLLEHGVGNLRILVQEIVHLLFDEITHIFIHRHSVRTHGQRTEFDLGLTFKHRFLHIDGNGRHDAVSDIPILEVLVIKLLDGLGNMLLESTLMSATLRRMLSVHERIVLLAILIGMREGYLYVLTLHVDDGIHGVSGHGIGEQIFQTIA